jgi:hypothetical protein
MPDRRDRSDRHRPPRRGRTSEDDSGQRRAQAAATNRTISVVALGAVAVGALVLWGMWGGSAIRTVAPAAPAAAPEPVMTTPAPVPAAPAGPRILVRGVNLGGDAVVIAGERWLSQEQALASGLTLGPGTVVAPATSIAAARLDFDTKTMLDNGCTAPATVQVGQSLPNGSYEVTLWVACADGLDLGQFALFVDGAAVTPGTPGQSAGSWARLGPYPAAVAQRRLDLALTGLGRAHLAGLTIASRGRVETTAPPLVEMTSPAVDAQLYAGDIPLVADVVAANGALAGVEFYDGATRLGAVLKPPYRMVWHQPPAGHHQLSAVASDSTAVHGRSLPLAMTVLARDDGSPTSALARAYEALRKLGLPTSALTQERDGVHLNLSGAELPDLAWLAGLPVVDLTLTKCTVGDLAPLAGLPLRRLELGLVAVKDLSVVKGLHLRHLLLWGSGITDLTPLAGMTSLDLLHLANCPVADLAPLAGMKLHCLYLQNSRVENLAPLAGMPLNDLNISGTKVRDLAPLAGMPLQRLLATRCALGSLAPLANLPLRTLGIGGVAVDLAPLATMPLEDLVLADSAVRDLAPLAGLRLKRLDVGGTQVSALTTLAGMPLERVILAGAPVVDLAPLSGLPITELDLKGCDRLKSLAPIATLTALRTLTLPARMPEIEALRVLKGVQVKEEGQDKGRDVAEFFATYGSAKGK